MSSGKGIDFPHTLASLPKPIDSKNGRTLASAVHSLTGLKKRKRTEVAVSIDGESVNIYSIQAPRLITSYAISPQSFLSAPPCSIVQRRDKKLPSIRYTYISTTQSKQKASNEVLCFSEGVHQDRHSEVQRFTYLPLNNSGRIISIDVIPFIESISDVGDAHAVIVVYQNGDTSCLSADLQTCHWTSNLWSISNPHGDAQTTRVPEIEHVSISPAGAALRGIFQGREDVRASLDPSQLGPSSVNESRDVISFIVRGQHKQKDTRSFCAFAIQKPSRDFISRQTSLQRLVSWELPQLTVANSTKECPLYNLHAMAGILHQLVDGKVVCYDLTGLLPRVSSVLDLPDSLFYSFASWSPYLVLATTPISLGLYDTRYTSLQAMLSLEDGGGQVHESRKRKRADSERHTQPLSTLISYPEAGLIVGIAGQELVGIQAEAGLVQSQKAGRKGGLLIDSIGKGVNLAPSADTLSRSTVPRPNLKWQKTETRLNEFAQTKDVKAFEALFATQIDVIIEATRNGLINGVKGDVEDLSPDESPHWDHVPEVSQESVHRYRNKGLYALSAIFMWTTGSASTVESKQSSISIQFLPTNVFRWLIVMGYLTKDMIEKALRQNGQSGDRTRSVTGGDIVIAVASYDPGLHLLRDVIELCQLGISEIVQSVKILIQGLYSSPNSVPNLDERLQLNGTTNGQMDIDQDDALMKKEVDAASSALDHVRSLLEGGLEIHNETLRWTLMDLHSFPPPAVVKSLRATLTHDELMFLIQILRIELNAGGWPSRYMDDEGDIHGSSDNAILTIADLLNYSLDAVGLAGWLNTPSFASGGSPDDLLHALRLEITAALEGIHEATYMRGLLGEFFLFETRKATSNPLPTNKQLKKSKKPIPLPTAAGDQDVENRMLPLGLKPKAKVEETATTFGDQVRKKSKREVGIEISMKVPKYSFERIAI